MDQVKRDIQINKDGQLVTRGYSRENDEELIDLGTVDRQLSVSQSIAIRLKTHLEEFTMHPQIGNELMKILGERNTRETANLGKNLLINTIIKDNYINESDLSIEVIPMSETMLLFTINAQVGPFTYVTMLLELDLVSGIRRVIES